MQFQLAVFHEGVLKNNHKCRRRVYDRANAEGEHICIIDG